MNCDFLNCFSEYCILTAHLLCLYRIAEYNSAIIQHHFIHFLEVAVRTFFVRVSTVAIWGILCCSIALSGGYQLNEHGARAVGLGGAFVAQASDPSAIYFNPAGLAFQQGINIYAGGTFVMPTHTYKSLSGKETSTDNQVFFPPSVYGTYAINSDLVVGLGVFTPYGLGTRWPAGWDGKYYAVNTQIQTFYINPSIAYKINDQLSVGIGVSYIYGSVDLSQNFAKQVSSTTWVTGSMAMSGTANTWGFNAGIFYRPIEKLSIGASVRTLSRLDFSGDVTYSDILPTAYAAAFKNGTGSATLPLPANVYVGAAYELTNDLKIEADLQFVGWSAYNTLTMSLPTGTVSSVKNWDDAFMGHVGAEYKLNTDWTLRGGLIYDITPQPKSTTEPMMPDADRFDISVGGGYKINDNLYIDAAYMIALFSEKTATYAALPGTYNSMAHVVSINVGYSF
jgi:long-chain fatty acid transport protein